MTTLSLLVIAGLLGVYWLNSNHARVTAIRAARNHCVKLGLQFLDGSVALEKTRPERVNGRLGFTRLYRFEYANQQMQRWVGYVIIHLPDRTRFQMDPASLGEEFDTNQRAHNSEPDISVIGGYPAYLPVQNALPTSEENHHGSDSIKKS